MCVCMNLWNVTQDYKKRLSPRRNEILIIWRIHCYFGKIKEEFLSTRTTSLFWDRVEKFFRIHNILVISRNSVEILQT